MKKIALLLLCAASLTKLNAQIAVNAAALNYSQDFNTLDTSATASGNLPTGWLIYEKGTSAYVNQMYRGNNGGSNTGDVYSYGDSTSTERALGSVASGTNTPSFGAVFLNNNLAASSITTFTLSFSCEQWRLRLGDSVITTDTSSFMYSTNASGLDDTLATWTPVSALDLNTVVFDTSMKGAVNGNVSKAAKTATVTLATPVNVGSKLYIKWLDRNILGSDDGLAVDDLAMTFTLAPTAVATISNEQTALTILGTATRTAMNLAYTVAEAGAYSLHLYDMTGRVVYSTTINASAGNQHTTVSGYNLPAGLYIAKLGNGSAVSVTKVSIQ